MTQEQFKEISQWQRVTFPNATPISASLHLCEEANELNEILVEDGTMDQVALEIADCFLLLIGVCQTAGMSYEDIIQAIDSKMEINKTRKWGKQNELGYVKHIED